MHIDTIVDVKNRHQGELCVDSHVSCI